VLNESEIVESQINPRIFVVLPHIDEAKLNGEQNLAHLMDEKQKLEQRLEE
jgi:hypothetical protein